MDIDEQNAKSMSSYSQDGVKMLFGGGQMGK